jgi:hypothetical protein
MKLPHYYSSIRLRDNILNIPSEHSVIVLGSFLQQTLESCITQHLGGAVISTDQFTSREKSGAATIGCVIKTNIFRKLGCFVMTHITHAAVSLPVSTQWLQNSEPLLGLACLRSVDSGRRWTGHYYFDEIRSSFELGSNSAFCTPLGIVSPTLSMLRSTKVAGYFIFLTGQGQKVIWKAV